MSHRRARRLGVAAAALMAAALLPASAGGHPADCDPAVAEAPTTDRFADWGGCNGAARSWDGAAQTRAAARLSTKGRRGRLRQVGHEPLMNRGMNAAIAVHEDYAYIGSRTDGGHASGLHGGLLVVDISRPAKPKVVNGPLYAAPGESTRELRVWQSQDVLIVLNTNCGEGDRLHHCTAPSSSSLRFYDIGGRHAKRPKLLTAFKRDTHEFYLWQDPKDRDRALVYGGAAAGTCAIRGGADSCPFTVWDISGVVDGEEPQTLYRGLYPYTEQPGRPRGGLHSLTVSNDGRRAYYALLTGGFAVVDVSGFAAGTPGAQPRPITEDGRRPVWTGPGAHSAAKLWGRDWAWVSDEVYGTATAPGHGCPWGWTRMVDISNPKAPTVEAEYREPENHPSSCEWNPPRTSYSAHNPTLTPHIGFSTWHSGGMQAISVARPHAPYQLAEFLPRPLRRVDLEDPRLSSDPDTGRNEKVVMWSYAILKDGLIYVVDLRNGLYVLRYRGPHEREVERARFLDGNSNQGDALCYEPVGRAPRHCR